MDTSRAITDQLPRKNTRQLRQSHYLQSLKSFSQEEVQYFLAIYNDVALQRRVDGDIYTRLSTDDCGRSVDELLHHFVSMFDLWASASKSRDQQVLSAIFESLEDLNIAVLAFHHKICLSHAHERNGQIKAIKQNFYHVSLN